MIVNVNGTFSKSEKLTVIIFLNDICALKLEKCLLTLFADDITMYCYGEKICAVRDMMTRDMELIYEWLQNNQLILNWNKTKAMCFSHSSRDQVDPFILPTNIFISIDGHDIEFVDEFRLLGITVDNKLTFYTHIRNIISRVNTKTVLIIKNLKAFPYKFRTTLFK